MLILWTNFQEAFTGYTEAQPQQWRWWLWRTFQSFGGVRGCDTKLHLDLSNQVLSLGCGGQVDARVRGSLGGGCSCEVLTLPPLPPSPWTREESTSLEPASTMLTVVEMGEEEEEDAEISDQLVEYNFSTWFSDDSGGMSRRNPLVDFAPRGNSRLRYTNEKLVGTYRNWTNPHYSDHSLAKEEIAASALCDLELTAGGGQAASGFEKFLMAAVEAWFAVVRYANLISAFLPEEVASALMRVGCPGSSSGGPVVFRLRTSPSGDLAAIQMVRSVMLFVSR
jgi:hypothetical protein